MFEMQDNSIYIVRGDSATLTFKVPNIQLVDGDSIEFTVRKEKPTNSEETPVIISSTTNILVDGIAEINLSATTTKVNIGKYWYDLRIKYANGNVDTLIKASRLFITTSINNS